MNIVDDAPFFKALTKIDAPAGVRVVVCVPFPYLKEAAEQSAECGAKAGAQDVSPYASGAYTGEVSCDMIKHTGAEYVIVGHSERRQYHNESDAYIGAKTRAALNSGLIPILCVGETLHERELGVTHDIINVQLKTALNGITKADAQKIVIAYEPVWAIGTGKTATPEDAAEVCAHIRAVLSLLYGSDAADAISILYGGSMNDANAAELLAKEDIDGGLIGGASLDAAKFGAIIKAAIAAV